MCCYGNGGYHAGGSVGPKKRNTSGYDNLTFYVIIEKDLQDKLK